MKNVFNYVMLTILASMVGVKAYAYDIIVKNADGVEIYYNYINDGTELEVTHGESITYKDVVNIPEEVTYMNRKRKVTQIGEYAFHDCSIKVLSIPNTVISIGYYAFYRCTNLTNVSIGKSVETIGNDAFAYCSSLNEVIIPNSVTSVGNSIFFACSSLISVTISNSLSTISAGMFYICKKLTSINIPNSVSCIENEAFMGCRSLNKITFGNSVTTIKESAFENCTNLTSITIPNSVKTIEKSAFKGCSGMTNITIPSAVSYIGENAFDEMDLTTVTSMINNPFVIQGKNTTRMAFSKNTFNNATLYVPKGTIEKYKATEGWKDFLFIEEGEGGSTTSEKCAKPTIRYQNGKLSFYSTTDGATYQYSITDSDIKTGSAQEVQLGVTYNISVYATKSGYEDSETAKATLCWIDVDPKTEGISNGVANVRAMAVMIQSQDGMLTIQGVDEGSDIAVYNVSGHMVGSTKAIGNQASLATNIKKGEVAIIKIGEKSVKVVM